jgi:outer membrane biosynthesis protein TonB
VLHSSGSQDNDNSAINAVRSAAPFKPLPYEYNGSYVDIQFSFDYNVIDNDNINHGNLKEFSI